MKEVVKKHHVKWRRGFKWISIGLFALYIIYALNLLVFGALYRVHDGMRRVNLIPFKTILNYVDEEVYYTPMILFNNLAGNVLVFMPLGFFLPLFFKKMRHPGPLILVSFCCTLLVESTQFILAVGTFDVDDLMLNTLGGWVGLLCFKGVRLIWLHLIHRLSVEPKEKKTN